MGKSVTMQWANLPPDPRMVKALDYADEGGARRVLRLLEVSVPPPGRGRPLLSTTLGLEDAIERLSEAHHVDDDEFDWAHAEPDG